MNITLLTAASPAYWDLLKVTAPNKLEYCLRHNIQLSMKEHGDNPNRISKERLDLIAEELNHYDIEWLWFMGSDTIITNHTKDVRDFIDEKYDLIIGLDVNGLNNDVFFLQNTGPSALFLERSFYHLMDGALHCQEAMGMAINELGDRLKVKIVHQKEFNSYLYSEYNYPSDNGGSFTEGDFVLHLPALSNERRIEIFNQYLPKVIK